MPKCPRLCLDQYKCPQPQYMEVSAPIKCRWVPHLLKMCYQALKNNTNSPLIELEWVKDGLCIYSGVCVLL